jgi:hypothetical protein
MPESVHQVSSGDNCKIGRGHGECSYLSWEHSSVSAICSAWARGTNLRLHVETRCHERKDFRGRVRGCREVLVTLGCSRRRRGVVCVCVRL